MDRPWSASVVIPAHDEEAVIGRCLSSLAASPLAERLQVVVVPNGCRDRTAEVARSFADRLPGLVVEDLDEPGKSGALNTGDAVATAFPRVFLDADIELGPGVVASLVETLDTPEPRVGSPSVRFDTSGASWGVRAFYRVFTRLPYVSDGLVGLGVYGLSAAGRARFDRFPDMTGDDLFVQRIFAPSERVTSPGEFVVRTPQTLSALARVRTRIAFGNRELASAAAEQKPALTEVEAGLVDAGATTSSTVGALARLLVRRPALMPAAAVYVLVTARARWAAHRRGSGRWHRDETSRAGLDRRTDD